VDCMNSQQGVLLYMLIPGWSGGYAEGVWIKKSGVVTKKTLLGCRQCRPLHYNPTPADLLTTRAG